LSITSFQPCGYREVAELQAAGCAKVYSEKVSGARSDRTELAKLMKRLQPGVIVADDLPPPLDYLVLGCVGIVLFGASPTVCDLHH
jgi:hypothetical protein